MCWKVWEASNGEINFYLQWMLKIDKNKKKQTDKLLLKQMKWKQNLENLFEIAHANDLNLIHIEKD